MTVYEIPNIAHCNVREIGNQAIMYKITSHEGWYIYLKDDDEETANVWKTAVALSAKYDFSKVQIIAEADLPEGAEIY